MKCTDESAPDRDQPFLDLCREADEFGEVADTRVDCEVVNGARVLVRGCNTSP